MSVLPTPPLILYLSVRALKHGNPISLVSFLGKDTLREACGNLLIPCRLSRVVLPSFIHQHSVSWESLMASPGQYLIVVPTMNSYSG